MIDEKLIGKVFSFSSEKQRSVFLDEIRPNLESFLSLILQYFPDSGREVDSAVGRIIYGLRLAISEPPFAHIRSAIGLDRLTVRTKKKVDIQWKLFCLVHNIKKIHTYGSGFGKFKKLDNSAELE